MLRVHCCCCFCTTQRLSSSTHVCWFFFRVHNFKGFKTVRVKSRLHIYGFVCGGATISASPLCYDVLLFRRRVSIFPSQIVWLVGACARPPTTPTITTTIIFTRDTFTFVVVVVARQQCNAVKVSAKDSRRGKMAPPLQNIHYTI